MRDVTSSGLCVSPLQGAEAGAIGDVSLPVGDPFMSDFSTLTSGFSMPSSQPSPTGEQEIKSRRRSLHV